MLPTSPAKLPLPGGIEGASVKLHPLLCGDMSGPDGWFNGPPGIKGLPRALGIGVPRAQLLRVPIPAFLIEHPGVGPIMIDTGFHASVIDPSERKRNLGRIGSLMTRDLKLSPEQTAVSQLHARAIAPSDVSLVVMTHLHFDHASALVDFPGTRVIVSGGEWHSATGRRASARGYASAQLDPNHAYELLDFSGPGARSHGPFDRALDLFGDGSLVLVSTPGHSAGHLSVIARLSDREALIAGDAIYTIATLREGKRPWRSDDPQAFERSLSEIQAYDREHPDAVIVPGHDMTHWRTLEPLYA